MKKQGENQPVDDLFARKLSSASLTPSSDSFERLRARMQKVQPEARVVFWRNPAVQRYMAAAACLLLIGLFGWLYMGAESKSITGGKQLANTPDKPQKPALKQADDAVTKSSSEADQDKPPVRENRENQLATVNKSVADGQPLIHPENKPAQLSKSGSGSKPVKSVLTSGSELPVLAQIPDADNKSKATEVTLTDVTDTKPISTEQRAEKTVKPPVATERVLTVMIEEPASIVAARQVAEKERNVVTISNEKAEKETKGGRLWAQVRRIKEGDVFARRDNLNHEDQGLLGRAYSGLKQSFAKDKPEK